MCKFHKDVAIAVATDPVTGAVDPLRYSITLVALAKFWVDKYMPDMGHQDGYSNYEMSSAAAQTSFRQSGLEQHLDKAREGQADRVLFLRHAANQIIAEMGLTPESLYLPERPDTAPRFLNTVMLGIYEGNPQIEWMVKDSVENKKHKPLRDAVARIFEIQGYTETIEESLKSSISNLFIQAPHHVKPKLLAAYDKFPSGLRTAFASCSLHSGGGALAHAVVCGGLNTAIGGLSGTLMNTAMYAVAPVVAVGTTWAVERYQLSDFNPYKYILPVAMSLSAAFAISTILPHEHSADPKMAMFYSLNAQQRYQELDKQYQRYSRLSPELRQGVEQESERQSMTIPMFMVSLDICGGQLTPRIRAYERLAQSDAQKIELK